MKESACHEDLNDGAACDKDDEMEHVLCIPREDLPAEWLLETVGSAMPEKLFFDRLRQARAVWIPRPEAEINPSCKQLIPYMVLRAAGKWIGCYRRNGTEARLHDLWSCGVGGHVNLADANGSNGCLQDILDRGLLRELDEEVPRRPLNCLPAFHGVINEEKTDVGRVHFGLVYAVDVPDPALLDAGDELSGFAWVPAGTIRSLNLELWSVLALDLIESGTAGK